jgi:hypothetical protein
VNVSRVVTLAVLGRSSDSSPTLAARAGSFWAAAGRSCWRTSQGRCTSTWGEVGDGRIEHLMDVHGVDRATAAHRASESPDPGSHPGGLA